MHKRQQNAITYVRKHGHPDLFITTTTNPNLPEIKNNLLPGQDPQDHPDIVARVFRLKVHFIQLNGKSVVYHTVICYCGYQLNIA